MRSNNSSAPASARSLKKKSRVTKPLERWLTRLALGCLRLVGRAVPYARAPALGKALGLACYALMPRYRRVALGNLRQAFGEEWDERRRRAVAKASFAELGTTLVEFLLHQPRFTRREVERWLKWDGKEHLDAAFARGRGVILVTGHYGNWELLGPRLGADGYAVHAIARAADDPGLDAAITAIRSQWGARLYPRHLGARRALELLRRNEMLVVHLDQNFAEGGIFVDFFGRPAATATGAARLAHRTGAALVCAFNLRQADRTHRLRVFPALYADREAPLEEEVYRLTAELTRRIEAQVRERPELWWWLHNRWKLQPEDLPGAAGDPASPAAERS